MSDYWTCKVNPEFPNTRDSAFQIRKTAMLDGEVHEVAITGAKPTKLEAAQHERARLAKLGEQVADTIRWLDGEIAKL